MAGAVMREMTQSWSAYDGGVCSESPTMFVTVESLPGAPEDGV